MGQILLSQEVPSAPPAGKIAIYVDPADGNLKALSPDGSVDLLSPSGLRERNYLINPEFQFAQRQVPGTLTTYSSTTARVYAADRWAQAARSNRSASGWMEEVAGSAAKTDPTVNRPHRAARMSFVCFIIV